jgi:hypothetical protein
MIPPPITTTSVAVPFARPVIVAPFSRALAPRIVRIGYLPVLLSYRDCRYTQRKATSLRRLATTVLAHPRRPAVTITRGGNGMPRPAHRAARFLRVALLVAILVPSFALAPVPGAVGALDAGFADSLVTAVPAPPA